MNSDSEPHRSGAFGHHGHSAPPEVVIRIARPEDIPAQVVLSRAVSGNRGAWRTAELRRHHEIFPEGQLVAAHRSTGSVLGLSASLVLASDQLRADAPWREVTGNGLLTTHDPEGDLLYGIGLAVHPRARGQGVARALYRAREALLERLNLKRIRVAARLPGYGKVAHRMTVEDYVQAILSGKRNDPTLSFQLHLGFEFVTVARDYLPLDTESRGHAAVVDWVRS